jgi:membrane-associated phospholipid phosphatase
MKKISSSILPFLIPSLLIISVAIVFIFITDKKTLFLEINQMNTPLQDFIFKYGTNIGDGLFSIITLIVFLFFFDYRKVTIGLVSFLLTSLFCRILKINILPDLLRPSGVFGPNELHFVEGVTMHVVHSFPSGHTATAFALFIFMAYVLKKRYLQILFAFTACFVGYSRVYLSQHFLIDVVAGAIVGMISFYIACILVENSKAKWLNNSLNAYWKKK